MRNIRYPTGDIQDTQDLIFTTSTVQEPNSRGPLNQFIEM
jgi:hypothetical protein